MRRPALIDIAVYYADWSLAWQLAQVAHLRGRVVWSWPASARWLLARALAQTGALDQFPSGRDRVEV